MPAARGSGVPPASVDVVLDLPGVGANLHDHLYFPVIYSGARPLPTGVNNHIEALGLLRSDPALEQPDLQVFFSVPVPSEFGNGYALVFALVRPHSRGRLSLASAEAGVPPVLDPNYLADKRDIEAMVANLRLTRDIGEAGALAPWRDQEMIPGPGVDDVETARDHLSKNLNPYWHYVGTCRIGTDEMAVVDLDLRVRGVTGLRVADASVMPSIPSANTYPRC